LLPLNGGRRVTVIAMNKGNKYVNCVVQTGVARWSYATCPNSVEIALTEKPTVTQVVGKFAAFYGN
jgi:hypothetical protein